ncbi:MAG: hypothetical protein IKL31_02250 [Ruminococcus sp.]|nr:hypothetical protein [Ruminococcus sp.]
MKRKILSLFLCSMVLSGTICSCGGDVPSESSVDDIISTTESSETSVSTNATEEITTEPQTEERSEFDFIKTVESTYICGQKLSYPITWGQFDEDFSIDYDSASINSEKQTISVFVKYQSYDIGIFGFTGCDSIDSINDNTIINGISVMNKDMDYFEMEKITINDLTLGIDHSQLFATFGDDYREGVGYNQIIYENDLGKYRFTFNDNDSLITVGLNILNNKNMEE